MSKESKDSKSKPGDDAPENAYRSSLFLPHTEFPMRAGLPKKEPEWLERWAKTDLYGRMRKNAKGRPKYVLHDGPPYANGNIHMGTAMNKILKDLVVRSQGMLGKDAPYVPGWDCHGLPIEWKVEEQYRKDGKSKDDVPVAEFRAECRDYAAKWIDIQREEFKRLGGVGDWDHPYTTMAFDAEAKIAEEFMKFVMDGSLYRGSKPVMWSVVEKTALAEAEIEYYEKKSPTIWVRFEVVQGDDSVKGASVVIWTTTPWTIPGNRAVSFANAIDYGVYEVKAVGEGSMAKPGEKLVLADKLAGDVAEKAKIEDWTRVSDAKVDETIRMRHALWGYGPAEGGYDFEVPMLDGDHVTDEAGTGFVHTAPGHGQEDYEIATVKHGIEVPHTVGEDGAYLPHVPAFAGARVFTEEGKDGDANGKLIKAMMENGVLLAKGSLRHSYAHSWRSKAPILYRNTPQWFVSMEKTGLRGKALKAIDETKWYPAVGRNRIQAMVEGRPDWVLSRQRAWGVPLTVFTHKETGEILRDEKVNARILEAFEAEGADVWFTADPSRFLGNDYPADDWEMTRDILDVWFDSGSTHAFVLEAREELTSPADLYLEGSDQHRGWFQSSLLESCGTRGRAPYKAVLTHGFVVAEDGRKMSKSLGNTIMPQDLIAQYGADIVRLWVAGADFTEDLRIGKEIIKSSVDAYRKLRNTMRYLLANLDGWDEAERIELSRMPALERWVLHRLAELDDLVRESYESYDFNRMFHALFNFCTVDLSSVYFDIRKDVLYCDRPDSERRRACRTVLDEVFSRLTAWFAPVLCFTMEEVWLTRFPSEEDSVHLRTFPEVPEGWRDDALAEQWRKVRAVRRVVTGALEVERRDGRIGSSLEAAPEIYVDDEELSSALIGLDLAELCITSDARLVHRPAPEGAFTLDDVAKVGVVPKQAQGRKCLRSWRILPEVGSHPKFPDLSLRDADTVEYLMGNGLWSPESGAAAG